MAKRKVKIPSYEEAVKELQQIVNGLQEEAVGVDALSEKVKRAAELIKICKEKLRSTETDIKGLFDN